MPAFKNPVGSGLRPERVDMGVDFGGSGPLYALGHGTITNVYPLGGNSGWPGGGWIGLRLDDGREMYYAEDVSATVRPGQVVNAGDLIGHATGGSTGIELGWASGQGTGTEAAALHQQNQSGDPGAFATAMGADMAHLIHSLGGPLGIISGSPRGTLPKGWQAAPSTGGPNSQPSSLTGGGSIIDSITSILGLGQATQFATDIGTILHAALWIMKPSNWLRIVAFFVGGILILFALYAFVSVGNEGPMFNMPKVVPVPV